MDSVSDRRINEPLENGLVLRRDDGVVWTNCPHLVVHHSPSGFEYGYMGSGPADLALNVVEAILHRIGYAGERMQCFDGACFSEAWRLHQRFKQRFIAPLQQEEDYRIPYETMKGWILEHKGEVAQ